MVETHKQPGGLSVQLYLVCMYIRTTEQNLTFVKFENSLLTGSKS